MRIKLLHGLASPREPLPLSEPVDSAAILFKRAPGRPKCSVLWEDVDPSATLLVHEVEADAALAIGGELPPGVRKARPVLVPEGTEGQREGVSGGTLVIYSLPRGHLTMGRREVRLAWTARCGGVERIHGLTRHVVTVLPSRPVGAWGDALPSVELLEYVSSGLGESDYAPNRALDSFLTRLAADPGQAVYHPEGDNFAAPPYEEVDRYLQLSSGVAGNDSAALIEHLAVACMTSGIRAPARAPPPVRVSCHGLVQLVGVVGHLLGLPLERWTFLEAQALVPLAGLGGARFDTGDAFSHHSVVVDPGRLDGGDLRVLDPSVFPGDRPEWRSPEEYAKIVGFRQQSWSRAVLRPSRPVFLRSLDDLRQRGEDGAALAERALLTRPGPRHTLWGVYVGRGEPGWARVVWISAAGMRCVAIARPSATPRGRSRLARLLARLHRLEEHAGRENPWVIGATRSFEA